MKKSVQTLLMATAISFAIFGPAHADDDDLQEMESISKSFGLIPLEQAKATALQAKPGVIKDAELENRTFEKGWDYEFEVVDADGKEWEVNVDAKTGKVRNIKRDWF
ncbi:propeptide domain-containing protein [Methylophilaceae bacterium 11]|uniref:PepSY domain-containing protein n=1 Tax=Methylotenera sp. 1P/1 TaxID=1131551 RepID=UPI0003635E59|nr:PepSY domain-containing protein [Methylotenera sp. 1P/1]EUJ09376.1 propeptide domain-containing protein [Methylophilaceae bacterium 11]